jgi:hypothetical protein
MTRLTVVEEVTPALLVVVTASCELDELEPYVRVSVPLAPGATVQPVPDVGAPKVYEAIPDCVAALLAVRVTDPVADPVTAFR